MKKNIYILYPAGYGGAYIHWCISKSEKDSAPFTVDDPLNKKDSLLYGGAGTAHLHHRIPTHQNIRQNMAWMIYNRPTEKKIYLVNVFNEQTQASYSSPEQAILDILQFDPDPVFIAVTNGGYPDVRKFGALNTLTKWPIFFKANQNAERKFGFDSFNCKNSIDARNIFAENFESIFPQFHSIHSTDLNYKLEWYRTWWNTRNTFNGHEVNETTYLGPPTKLPIVHTLTVSQAMSPNFIPWFDNFVSSIDAGDFNTEFVTNYHQSYVDAQDTLKWFDGINEFRKTYQLTEYLRSHSLLQAFVIMEVKNLLPKDYNWKLKSIDEIVTEATRHRV
jgi:hypothetical protein